MAAESEDGGEGGEAGSYNGIGSEENAEGDVGCLPIPLLSRRRPCVMLFIPPPLTPPDTRVHTSTPYTIQGVRRPTPKRERRAKSLAPLPHTLKHIIGSYAAHPKTYHWLLHRTP